MKKKTLALVLALTLLVAGVVGGTLAWLTDQTAEVKNTFTVGDINIGLTETTTDYKMVPGNTIAKDPAGRCGHCCLRVLLRPHGEPDHRGSYGLFGSAAGLYDAQPPQYVQRRERRGTGGLYGSVGGLVK